MMQRGGRSRDEFAVGAVAATIDAVSWVEKRRVWGGDDDSGKFQAEGEGRPNERGVVLVFSAGLRK